MGINPIFIVDPARVKILCVPVGRIRHSNFLSFLQRLERENVVPLRDVSPDSRSHTTLFSPLSFPAGRVFFDIGTSAPPAAHLALSPFELYRQPLIVVAVADSQSFQYGLNHDVHMNGKVGKGESASTLSEESIQSLLQHRQQLASDFSSALVHQLIVFDYDGAPQRLPDGICLVPSPAKSKTTTIKTIMCDLSSQLLAEMTSFARSLQELTSLDSPKAPRQNIHRPLARYFDASRPASANPGQQLHGTQRNEHRMSMPAHILASSSSRSSTPESRPTSPPSGVDTPPMTINGTTSSPASPPFRAANPSRPMSRDRASLQGFGSDSQTERERSKHRGRMSIVRGSMYLLAGRWPDAVKETVDGATVAKANNDHVWHGKALDHLLVICLLYAWAGLDFQIPQALLAATEKSISGPGKASKERLSSSHADLKAASAKSDPDSSLHNLVGLLPELVTVVQNLYSRAWVFTEDKLPQVSFSDTGLRSSRLLTIVEASNGKFTDTNLQQIVMNVQPQPGKAQPSQVSAFPSKAEITAFLFRSFPSPGTDDSLTVVDRTRILASIASILGELGYHRKKAYVLKELLRGLIPALVEARKRGAAEMGIHPAASLASLDAAVLGARGRPSQLPFGENELGVRGFLYMVCHAFGIDLANRVRTDPHGESIPEAKPDGREQVSQVPSNEPEAIKQRAIFQVLAKSLGSVELKMDILRLCIHICEALPDLEGVLDFSAELLRTSGSGIAPGPEDNHGSPALSIDEQLRLWTNISRTVGAARQLGVEHLAAHYWDDFLVRGVDLIPSISNHPVSHAKDDLDTVAKSTADAATGPFLYNPFSQNDPAKSSKPLVVAGEEAVFRVTLQNLYDFDLEIDLIRLGSSEVDCSAQAQACLVGPYRTQSVFLTATWSKSGSANVSGCMAKIRGCRERWFPLFDRPWSLKPDMKVSQGHGPVSHSIQPAQAEGRSRKKDSRASQGPIPSTLGLDIISALPNILLKNISLPQSAIMLLEGEVKSFNITLHNTSESVTADLVLPTFKDSTATQLQTALAKKELTPSELYDVELAAARTSLRWLRESDDTNPVIRPGDEMALEIEVVGKPGLSNASIQISFAHLGVPPSELKERFYTRQLSIPLTITVNASVDLTRTDLLPFNPSFAWQNQQRRSPQSPSATKPETSVTTRRPSSMSTRPKSAKPVSNENRFQALLSRIGLSPNDTSHCLLCLDCRNSWRTPLSVSIQVRAPTPSTTQSSTSTSPTHTDPSKLTYTVHESLQPGHTKRILLLLPRVRLPAAHRSIPSLAANKKQFIVPTSPQASRTAQLAARESFWYREELLRSIHATWTEESTQRTGSINTRKIRLSREMVAAYMLPEIGVDMSLAVSSSSSSSSSSSDPEHGGAGAVAVVEQFSPTGYTVPLSTFLTLTAAVTNHSTAPVHVSLRLRPRLDAGDGGSEFPSDNAALDVDVDVGRKFLVHGLLQQVLPVLAPGEKRAVDVGVVVLGRGRWVVGGVVEEVRVFGGGGGGGGGDDGEEEKEDEELKGGGGAERERERRVWGIEDEVVVVGRG